MGCCGSQIDSGEQIVNNTFWNMRIWETPYDKIKNTLFKLSSSEIINRDILHDQVFKLYIEPGNPYERLQTIFFNFLHKDLRLKESMYLVLLYLYSFLALSQETQCDHFYQIMLKLNHDNPLRFVEIKKYLKDFLTFNLITVSHVIADGLLDNPVARDQIQKNLDTVFTSEHIDAEVNAFIELLKKEGIDEDNIVTIEFIKCAKSHMRFSFWEIRDHYISKYGEH